MPKRASVGALVGLLVFALVAVASAARVQPASGKHAGPGQVRMNQIQAIGTHNSYHREISRQEEALYEELIERPDNYDDFLAYSHASIPSQFTGQEVRGLELDLLPDPQGGLYAEPLLRQRLGLGPFPDPAWQQPGVKVFHITDFDYATTCVQLLTCLEQVRTWSDANPGHVPILILLELKQSDQRAVRLGGVVAPPWEIGALDSLDAEIRSVFDESDMITPDDVRVPGLTLEQSVRRHGWPSLREARGQVAFLLDNDPGPIRDAYTAGRPSLEGRVIFTSVNPGNPDAAFVKRNDPLGANTARIQDLVEKGYLVRTRSDLPLQTVRSGDTTMLEAALRSGAQVVSTDFPAAGMSARYGSDYVARLPERGTARCNPVNAPRRCRSGQLEP